MLNKTLLILLVLASACSAQQNTEYVKQIAAHRMQLNEEFFNPIITPVDSADFANFKGLKFYPINQKYKVTATLTLNSDTVVFELPHSRQRTKPYKVFGTISFVLLNQTCQLQVLEQANKKPGYEDYLIIPFTDLTNGETTYGGGRYIEFTKPKTNTFELDFNLCFNPYCAYNGKYTCPIPPKENNLAVKIEAGMKYESLH